MVADNDDCRGWWIKGTVEVVAARTVEDDNIVKMAENVGGATNK